MKLLILALIVLLVPLGAVLFIETQPDAEVSSMASITVARSAEVRRLLSDSSLDQDAGLAPEPAVPQASLSELLVSTPVVTRAQEAVWGENLEAGSEDLASRIAKGLTMSDDPARGLTRVTLEMEGDAPALDILRALVEDPEVSGIRPLRTTDDMAPSVTMAQEHLRAAEEELQQFETTHAITDRQAEQNRLMELSASLYGKLLELKQEHEGAKAEINVIEDELSKAPTDVLHSKTTSLNQVYVEGLMRLFDLEMERDQIRQKYAAESPWQRRIDAQINVLRDRIAETAKIEVTSSTWVHNEDRDGLFLRAIEARVASAVSEAMIDVIEGEQTGLWARALELKKLANRHEDLMARREEADEGLAMAQERETRAAWAVESHPPFVVVGTPEASTIKSETPQASWREAGTGLAILLGLIALVLVFLGVKSGAPMRRSSQGARVQPKPSWTAASESVARDLQAAETGPRNLRVVRTSTSQPLALGPRASRPKSGFMRDLYWIVRGREKSSLS